MTWKVTVQHLLNRFLPLLNLDAETCEAVSLGLCETSLRGMDSHEIRLLPHYTRSALLWRKNPRPNYSFKHVFPAFGHLDVDNPLFSKHHANLIKEM